MKILQYRNSDSQEIPCAFTAILDGYRTFHGIDRQQPVDFWHLDDFVVANLYVADFAYRNEECDKFESAARRKLERSLPRAVDDAFYDGSPSEHLRGLASYSVMHVDDRDGDWCVCRLFYLANPDRPFDLPNIGSRLPALPDHYVFSYGLARFLDDFETLDKQCRNREIERHTELAEGDERAVLFCGDRF